MNNKIRVLKIKNLPIEMFKVLKIDNQVQSGGEGKFVISEGLVRLNGEVELRKAKKIFHGDVIEFEGDVFKIEEE